METLTLTLNVRVGKEVRAIKFCKFSLEIFVKCSIIYACAGDFQYIYNPDGTLAYVAYNPDGTKKTKGGKTWSYS